MPGQLDGFGLAREVATHWPHIAIVIASGRAQPGPDEVPDGARFVAKPFSAQVVRDHLREMIPPDRQPGPCAREAAMRQEHQILMDLLATGIIIDEGPAREWLNSRTSF